MNRFGTHLPYEIQQQFWRVISTPCFKEIVCDFSFDIQAARQVVEIFHAKLSHVATG